MMQQCQKCLFYDKKRDEERQSWNDIIFMDKQEEKEETEEHYCGIFQPIPEMYVLDQVKCPAFIKK